MPSATHRHTAVAERSIDEVWLELQKAETWENIGPVERVWDPIHEEGRLKSYKWKATVGPTSYDASATVVAADEPQRMELALDATEVTGALTTVLSNKGDGKTAVEVTLKIVSRGMLSSLFFPVISEAIGNGLPEQVQRFAKALDNRS